MSSLGATSAQGSSNSTLFLDGRQVFNRDLHGKGPCLPSPRPGASRALDLDTDVHVCAISPCTPAGVSVSIGPFIMGLAGFTLADRLGAKSSPCSVPGCTRTWISIAGGKGAKLGGRGAADPSDPASSMCDPCRETFAKRHGRAAPLRSPGLRRNLDLDRQGRRWRRSPPSASRRAGLCAGCEAKLAALEDKPLPCAVPGCTRTSVFSRKRAQLLAGAPEIEPALAGAPLRAVRGRLPQAEGPRRPLRHQRLRAEVDLDAPTSRSRPTPRPDQRAAAADVRGAARPTSARSPTARSAAAPPAARRPGSGRAAISSTPASPASRRPRRRTGCARAASGSTRR